MKIINHIKAGASVAPAFSIILYYLFVALDIYTTSLASPDLRYEGNLVIRYFNLNWSQIIILGSLIVLFITLGLLIALNFIHKYYQENIKYNHSFIVEVFHKRKLLISFIIICCFFAHLFYSIFVTISNYLQYIYLFKIENALTKISTCYVNKVIMIYPHIFTWVYTFFIFAALFVAAYKVKKIRNKYRTMSM